MPPTIVTHVKPHIDDICAAWLLKRYLPAWRGAEMKFVPPDTLEPPVTDTPEKIHVGVGRGQFDEHKGDIGECAASLVYRHINKSVVLNANERKALDKLIDWVLREDTGKLLSDPNRPFTVPSILEDIYLAKGKDSEAVFELGSTILDALLVGMRNQVDLDADWQKRTEFKTAVGGQAVALISNARQLDSYAYSQGFDLFLRQTPDGRYTEIRLRAESDSDLKAVRDGLAKTDYGADWFFHHSGKLLLNGGDMTSRARLTSLGLKELTEILTSAELFCPRP
jgi:hypothetical protein